MNGVVSVCSSKTYDWRIKQRRKATNLLKIGLCDNYHRKPIKYEVGSVNAT